MREHHGKGDLQSCEENRKSYVIRCVCECVRGCGGGCVYDLINDSLPPSPQLSCEAGVLVKAVGCDDQGESGVDNGEMLEECSSK